jgi:predicted nucleic acid-binding protein
MRIEIVKNTVLDSYALLAFLYKEKGHNTVLRLFEKALETGNRLLMASPNWAEVRYTIERKAGTGRWAEVKTKLLGLPIDILGVDQELAELAGEIKAFHKMSLADSFAAALARVHQAEIYTGDPEFKTIEEEQKICWL